MLIQNHKRIETAAKLKKFYSTMTNAVKLAETETGLATYEWTINNNIKLFGTDGAFNGKTFFEQYYGKYLNYIDADIVSEGNKYYDSLESIVKSDNPELFIVHFNDGTLMYIDGLNYLIDFDVNGEKSPNKAGRDIFGFLLLVDDDNGQEPQLASTIPHFNTSDYSVIPYEKGMESMRMDIDKAIRFCGKNADSTSCSYIVQTDGWEFTDRYPLRL